MPELAGLVLPKKKEPPFLSRLFSHYDVDVKEGANEEARLFFGLLVLFCLRPFYLGPTPVLLRASSLPFCLPSLCRVKAILPAAIDSWLPEQATGRSDLPLSFLALSSRNDSPRFHTSKTLNRALQCDEKQKRGRSPGHASMGLDTRTEYPDEQHPVCIFPQ